jgi:hypothetical protein
MIEDRRETITKNSIIIAISALMIMSALSIASAGGPFGPPQTVSRQGGGLNTAIGNWYHEDTYVNGSDHIIRQNEIYSQVAYGAENIWEIYGRVGIADMKVSDAFRSTSATTATFKNDFAENGKFTGTLGAKGFYPFNKIFGIGAYLQGTLYFSNFSDDIAGRNNGTPFTTDLKVSNLWDVNLGIGFQAAVPLDIKLYMGPYVYYSEGRAHLAANIAGLDYAGGNVLIRNKTNGGGFAGLDIPLPFGFRLNVEGQYSDRLSAGASVSYVY